MRPGPYLKAKGVQSCFCRPSREGSHQTAPAIAHPCRTVSLLETRLVWFDFFTEMVPWLVLLQRWLQWLFER